MMCKHSLIAAGAIIGIILIVALTTTLTSPTANFAFEKSIDDDITNCVGLRIQCKNCAYVAYNWRDRQMCASLCDRYFEKCYEKRLPVTPLARG